jgi:hydrogenase maturation protease
MLVIGIGSLIMKDDGIGTRIAETLKSQLQEQDIYVLIGETDFRYCFDEIQSDDFLVILDAVMPGNEPGSITITPLCDALNDRAKLHAQHDFSLFDAIYLHYPDMKGAFIGIETAAIEFGFELSERLEACFDKICGNVLNVLIGMKETLTAPCEIKL